MEYAKDQYSGSIVAATDASPRKFYLCPRPGCGGRVYLPDVVVQRPHFRHYPGEGTPACDQYFPGVGNWGRGESSATAAVEDDPSELGLLLSQQDGHWGLGLRLPEIPSEELGDATLQTLRSAYIDVFAGRNNISRVSALILRPGVEMARVDIVPSLHPFHTQPTGSWPVSIDKLRWHLESRGLETRGTFFRLRRGEWMRLLADSGVHPGETLIVLADKRHNPPVSIISQIHPQISNEGMQWTIWEIRIPFEPTISEIDWLAQLGHELIPRPWRMDLATPPRVYSERWEPIFWVGDAAVITLESPKSEDRAMVVSRSGQDTQSSWVTTSVDHVAHLGVTTQSDGLTHLSVETEESTNLDIAFIQRPTRAAVQEILVLTPRLRIQIDGRTFEAWHNATYTVDLTKGRQPEVQVDIGAENARAHITVWERGKQRFQRGLDAHGVGRVIEESLEGTSRIEIDADNLGRVVLIPRYSVVTPFRKDKINDRLVWRDLALSQDLNAEQPMIPTLLEIPRPNTSLIVRHVQSAGSVRARLALRQRIKNEESRS